MTPRVLSVAVVLVALLAGGAFLLWPHHAPSVLVEDARLVATDAIPGKGAVYLRLSNASGSDAHLIGAKTDIAATTELRMAGHAMMMGDMAEDGTMDHGSMDTRGDGGRTVIVPSMGEALLTAETVFVALDGIDRALEEGEIVPLTLSFHHAGDLAIKARVDAIVPEGALASHGGLFVPPQGEPSPTLALRAELGEDRRVTLSLDTTDFTFDEAGADGPHVPGHGHAHLYINTIKIGRVYGPIYVTEPLESGRHVLSVTLNTNDHRSYGRDDATVSATAVIEIP